VQTEEAFQRGRVEIQDEGSQLCALLAGAAPGQQVLDFCAGAGGKTLALAAQMENRGQLFAFDADRNRLAPIFDRLKRAGARNVQVRSPSSGGLDDLVGRMDRVLVDAPCSGTGVWRRRPDTKWRLTPDSLNNRIAEQDSVLREGARFLRPGGVLAYATCSLLPIENEERIAAFLQAHSDFNAISAQAAWAAVLPGVAAPSPLREPFLALSPKRTGTDGFFLALLQRQA
jgi:16S rRNA (cytosine967-C5)-methyltransferase